MLNQITKKVGVITNQGVLAFASVITAVGLFNASAAYAVPVDCDATPPDSIAATINAAPPGPLFIDLSGTCNEEVFIFRDDVFISGQSARKPLSARSGWRVNTGCSSHRRNITFLHTKRIITVGRWEPISSRARGRRSRGYRRPIRQYTTYRSRSRLPTRVKRIGQNSSKPTSRLSRRAVSVHTTCALYSSKRCKAGARFRCLSAMCKR